MTPAQAVVAFADLTRALTGWRRWLAAVAAGVLAALSLPPADLLPVLWISIPILLWLLEAAPNRAAAFWLGWCFGFGYLAVSLYWLTFALFVAIDRYWWLVPFASNGLAAGLAIFWGIAAFLAACLPRDRPLARVFALVAAWSTCEWLRGHILTGFPWNLPGYAWTDYPWLIQSSAAIGIYGVTALALLAPALAAPLGSRYAHARTARIAALSGLGILAVVGIAGLARLPSAPVPIVDGIRLRIVQPNIPESLKWVEEREVENFRRHVELSQQTAAIRPNVIVWPEAAIPFGIDDAPDVRSLLAKLLPPNGALISGTVRSVPGSDGKPSYRNSLQVIDATGRVAAAYDKFHLVPFGEYMPLRNLTGLAPIVDAVAPGGDLGTGPGPTTLDVPGIPPFSPLICYEAIFPHDVTDRAHRPAWIVGITNDAWFGLSAGPHQDFSIARVRTIEEGLPMVRAANDGVSGVIDPYGRIIAQTKLGEIAVLDSDLPQSISVTFYSRFGDIPFFGMIAALVAAALALRRKASI